MGLTTNFYKYIVQGICNEVATSASVLYVDARQIILGAGQRLYLWNLKSLTPQLIYEGGAMIRRIAVGASKLHYAVGLSNGTVDMVNINSEPDQEAVKVSFSGHRRAVTCLAFDQSGTVLASGGQDNLVILWDVVNECGMFRLQGHQAPVTHCQFVHDHDTLVTSSKDTTIKFWNIQCKQCFYTLSVSNSEIWAFVFNNLGNELIVGTSESQLVIYDIEWYDQSTKTKQNSSSENQECNLETEENPYMKCVKFGSVFRHSKNRVSQIDFSPDGKFLFCASAGKGVDVYRAYEPEEVTKRIKLKLKKLKLKSTDGLSSNLQDLVSKDVSARYHFVDQLKFSSKLRCLDFYLQSDSTKIFALLNDNSFEEWHFTPTGDRHVEFTPSIVDTNVGHRSHVRAVKFSNDAQYFLSVSAESVKVWTLPGMHCIRTFQKANGVSAIFLPTNQVCVVATVEGTLVAFDITNSCEIGEVQAHEGKISSIAITSDQREIVTCGADSSVKFWNLEAENFALEQSRTLSLNEEVTCFNLTANDKFLIVGLLDNTAKVFFVDSFKFFLSLYGHSLPVLACDSSDDGELVVTGSADRTIKIWGLDFGDCHRSLVAHDDSVTCVKFVAKTHLFFTAGKDRAIKQWCADKFVKIAVLDGHLGEIWAMDISGSGNSLITASHDYSIRLWQMTEELLVLQEEQDLEREMAQTKALEDVEDVVPGSAPSEPALAVKRTEDTVRDADHLMDAIDLCKSEMGTADGHVVHPLLQAINCPSVDCYVMDILRRVPSSHLEKCLVMLPLSYVADLLYFLNVAFEKNYEVELALRCSVFLVRIHYFQIMDNEKVLPLLRTLEANGLETLRSIRDNVGTNLAALRIMEAELNELDSVNIFSDVAVQAEKKRAKKRVKPAYLLKM